MKISNSQWIAKIMKHTHLVPYNMYHLFVKLAQILLDEEIRIYTIVYVIQNKFWFPEEVDTKLTQPLLYMLLWQWCHLFQWPYHMVLLKNKFLERNQNGRPYEKGVCECMWSSLRTRRNNWASFSPKWDCQLRGQEAERYRLCCLTLPAFVSYHPGENVLTSIDVPVD